MTEPIFCPAQTFSGTRLEPAEYCTEEVADYGDLCARHDEDDRADELYEQYLEARYEQRNYEDFGE